MQHVGIAIHDINDVDCNNDGSPHIFQLMTQSTETAKILWDPTSLKRLRLRCPQAKLYAHAMFKMVIGKGYTIHLFREHYKYLCEQHFHGYVVHIPANIEVNYCVGEIKRLLKSAAKHLGSTPARTTVYFEHVPSEYYSENMHVFGEKLRDAKVDLPVGLCIDTCHLYASGISLSSIESARNYITQIENVGLPLLIHLNDSIGDLGSFVDRHAELGTKIWKDDKSGLKYIKNTTHDKIIELADPKSSLELLLAL